MLFSVIANGKSQFARLHTGREGSLDNFHRGPDYLSDGFHMQTIKYRCFQPGLRLGRTKIEVPGWAGPAEPRRNGSHEQAWHCTPFTEGAQYGIELF